VMPDVECAYFREWKEYPHWCITHWKRCKVVGCPDYEPPIVLPREANNDELDSSDPEDVVS
jgi:hypothetical protein